MKIAIFHELHNGGARRAVNELAKRLKKNHEVDLYLIDEKDVKSEYKYFNNVYFYKFIPKKWQGGDWKTRFYKDTKELLNLHNLHKKIAKIINGGGYDVVFVHPSKYTQAPFILRYLESRSVYYCQEGLRVAYEEQFAIDKNIPLHKKWYESISRSIRKNIDKKNIKSADHVLTNSLNTQNNLKRIYGIKSKVVYLGVDTDFFKPLKIKKNIDVLYIGAKDETDGYFLLNDALSQISNRPKSYFHITGKEWLSDTEFRKLYNRSKIVVCLAKNEPFGLIPLEAASCGIPVIALRSGGYNETLIDKKSGFFTSGNPKDLASKINTLLTNGKKHKKISDFARNNTIENWTWEKSASDLQKYFSNSNNYIKKSAISLKTKIIILSLIFIFSLLLRLTTLNEIGRTWDEQEYIDEGYNLVELIKRGDFTNPYFYTTYDHPPLVRYLYGTAAHLDIEEVKKGIPVFKYDYTFSRILSSVMFCIGVVLTVIIGWKLFSPLVGIISGIILSMLPFSLGLSQLVTTESLKILLHPIAILSYLNLLEKFTWKKVVIAGILTGVALQGKQSNALLLIVLALAFYFQYRYLKQGEKKEFAIVRAKAILLIAILSFITFFTIWPQGLLNLNEVSKINSQLWAVKFSPKPWQITLSPPEIFFGRLILTPVFYYFVYFFITIPMLIIILFFIGFKNIYKSVNISKFLILLWFCVPFIMSFYSWRQHGLRYIIEIYPAIAIISAVGFGLMLKKFSAVKLGKIIATLLLILYLIANIWSVRPYYLDYFNELVGGTGTVWKYNLFQTGWWGQGIREAGLYVTEYAPRGSKIGLAMSPEHTIPKSESLEYLTWTNGKKFDFVIVNHYHIIRDGFDDTSIRESYNLIHEVKAGGATLVYVYKKR